jgi:ABC-2 type transport system ATP-binding protein
MAPDERSPAVRIEGLVKRLGRGVTALDGLDLVVERGTVTALAGPNGAGKSVTMKVLRGLVRPTAGRAFIFGEPVSPGAPVLGRVGTLVDGPGFVPHLSGLENLRLAWRLARGPDSSAGLEDAVSAAGLGDAISRPYRTYSHGMRYRLALAQALLGRPELLLLDEPTTGLDPAHVREVRGTIAAAVRRGATVLLSSHLLSEVELVCTHVAVMGSGRVVAAGPVAEMVGPATGARFDVSDPRRASEVLAALPGVGSVDVDGSGVRVSGQVRPAALLWALDGAGVAVRAFHAGRTLEEAYLDLLGGGSRG